MTSRPNCDRDNRYDTAKSNLIRVAPRAKTRPGWAPGL